MNCGFVAILGRPNVGKSTLLNALLSKKVSIVSPKAQTTRDDIIGILNEKDYQIVFIDTPGLFAGKAALDATMNKRAREALKDVEAVVYMVDCSDADAEAGLKVLSSLKIGVPLIVVLNKTDLVRIEVGFELKKRYEEAFPHATVLFMSATMNSGISEFKNAVKKYIPEGPQFYPTDAVTDKDKRFEAKEEIRREILRFVKDEVPHESAVVIDSFEEKDGGNFINATIFVEKKSQISIVVGKEGAMIKKISMTARRELERMWHEHVTLLIEVKCAENWRNSASKLAKFGYGEE